MGAYLCGERSEEIFGARLRSGKRNRTEGSAASTAVGNWKKASLTSRGDSDLGSPPRKVQGKDCVKFGRVMVVVCGKAAKES